MRRRHAVPCLLLAACAPRPASPSAAQPPESTLEYHWVIPTRGADWPCTTDPRIPSQPLSDSVALSLTDVARAEATSRGAPETGGYTVLVRLTADGSARWRTTTAAHVGRCIAVVLDGRVVDMAFVQSPLAGIASVKPGVTRAEADSIVSRLNAAVHAAPAR